VIHYAAPNGKIYPFCAYNSGPVYRERGEREFSVPLKRLEKNERREVAVGKKVAEAASRSPNWSGKGASPCESPVGTEYASRAGSSRTERNRI
jgi:hypothetical protein